MKYLVPIACTVAAAACFVMCMAVLGDSQGFQGLYTDGRDVFDAGASIRQKATFGLVVSGFSFVAIVTGQLLGQKVKTRIMSFSVAFVLISVMGLAFTVSTLRQFR